MESYREEIEKEAEEYWRLNRCENKGFLVYELFNGGVNSKISERIKIDFAVECLNEIISYACDEDVFFRIEAKISKLNKLKNNTNGK